MLEISLLRALTICLKTFPGNYATKSENGAAYCTIQFIENRAGYCQAQGPTLGPTQGQVKVKVMVRSWSGHGQVMIMVMVMVMVMDMGTRGTVRSWRP